MQTKENAENVFNMQEFGSQVIIDLMDKINKWKNGQKTSKSQKSEMQRYQGPGRNCRTRAG